MVNSSKFVFSIRVSVTFSSALEPIGKFCEEYSKKKLVKKLFKKSSDSTKIQSFVSKLDASLNRYHVSLDRVYLSNLAILIRSQVVVSTKTYVATNATLHAVESNHNELTSNLENYHKTITCRQNAVENTQSVQELAINNAPLDDDGVGRLCLHCSILY
jgi:hypothetical protein